MLAQAWNESGGKTNEVQGEKRPERNEQLMTSLTRNGLFVAI